VRASIVGASGYIGGELLRLLLFHPKVEVTTVTSRSYLGEYVYRIHSNLRKLTDLKFEKLNVSQLAESCDLVFTATPHGSAMKLVPELLKVGLKVIDLSADFRLKNPSDYVKWYHFQHSCPELLEKSVYGLPELHREEIRNSGLIACPGCMATPSILGLAPIVKAEMVEKDRIVIDAKIGSSGAGVKPTMASHHAERFGGVRPYKTFGHRHTAEVEQELSLLVGEPIKISFTPHAVNMVRGILTTTHAFPKSMPTPQDLWKAYRASYGAEPFVRLVRDKKGLYQLPNPKILIGTNFCDIGFDVDPHANRLIILGAIDNMMKGAAGQAVQCLNITLNLDERTGLEFPGFHPV